MYKFFEIASKAQYIHDVAEELGLNGPSRIVDAALADSLLRELEAIADKLDELYNWDLD